MTTTFNSRTFDEFRDRNSGAEFSGLAFERCTFLDPVISKSLNPQLRSTIHSVTMRNCRARQGDIGSAIVEDVLIDGFRIVSVIFG